MPDSSPAPQILVRPQAPAIAYHLLPAVGEKMQGAPGVMFMGGFASDMTGIKAMTLNRLCRKRGQGYLRFDYRGHGASAG